MSRVGHHIKAALHQIHSIAGLVLALLLALIALTGAIMSFEDEIGDHLNSGIMQVAPRQAPALMPDELVARLKAGQDLGKVSAVTLSSDPAAAVRVRFARDEQGARPTSLYVDPYDARVLGAPRGEEFFATVRRLHRWLLIPGDAKGWGRQITGIAALGLIVMLISGLVLRWPRRAGSVKMWLKPNLGLSGRGLHRSLHAVIGTWVLPVYLVMTLTGLWYSFDWYKDGVVWLLSRPEVAAAKMQPKMSAKVPRPSARPEPAQPIGFDQAWTTLQHEEGKHFSRALLTLPAGPGTVIRIRSWPKGFDARYHARRIPRGCGHGAGDFGGALCRQDARPEDHRERARHPSRRVPGLAGQARLHDCSSVDAAVLGHRHFALSVAPQAAASRAAAARAAGSGRVNGREG
ncbi:hypothetical protein ACVWZ3_008031 [Bradyrhizobium sp. i1.3.6]